MKGFFFKTKKGNEYFYDDITGNVIFVKSKNDIKKLQSNYRKKYFYDNKKINVKNIKNYIKNKGSKELFFIVTEDCNLRCKYCAYSGEYSNMRTHNNVYMDYNIAKKAIDKYFSDISNTQKINPYFIPAIGFYGGEPLINFDLIKKTIMYIKNKKYKCHFTITTNGTILNDEIIKFLAENEVSLAFSLNGFKEEHDRLRVFSNQNGTFEIVYNNLLKIKEKYPFYYKKYCSIIACYDYGTDLFKMKDFFDNSNLSERLIRLNMIGSSYTNWYNQYSKEKKEKFFSQMRKLKNLYFHKIKKNENDKFLSLLFGLSYFAILNRNINVNLYEIRPSFLPFTGTCVPGEKIAISPSGDLHCCEKINYDFPIGNVENWLDYSKIEEIVKKYNKKLKSECLICPVSRLCPLCFALLAGNGEFKKDPPDICENVKEGIKKSFEEIWNLLEEGVNIFDLIKFSKYKQCGVYI
ncbi:arylsulfatase regulator (Fe-S oxidoreductase) [Marinitoga piezophila KA3]|uniref:Arylsulfatase regulator (Fe-S oxidoreductase) n=1 Tax=Marinitoga piezophila (strain DSM 14283 / JCM 11233 / KA3) TaxID=443254 RepID=H2J7E0_MARPK|nr:MULTISPECIES: radical SAM protein [Marinitoga]AEX85332.1 arylsulfatase regulator (Fe-S oxidoreductase) [Marinitoga piezophila KA3]